MPKIRSGLICFVTIIIFSGYSNAWCAPSTRSALTDVVLEKLPQADILRIQTDTPALKHKLLQLDNPKRFAIDLPHFSATKLKKLRRIDGTLIRNLRVGSHEDRIRIAADLPEALPIHLAVREEGKTLIVEIKKVGTAEENQSVSLPNPNEAAIDAPVGGTAAGKISLIEKPNPSEDAWAKSSEDTGGNDSAGNADWAKDSEPEEENTKAKSSVQIFGMIRDKLSIDTEEDSAVEDDLQNRAQFQAGIKYVPNNRFHLLLSANVDYFQYLNGGDWNNDGTVRLHNAYLNWSSSTFNFKLGNQIVRWGKTDGYSPLDNLNPEDYRDGVAGRREDRKIPIPMANLEVYRDKFTLQGVYIPVFIGPNLDAIGTDWAYFQHADKEINGFKIYEEDPSDNLRNSEVGLRFSGTLGKVDFGLNWFYGRENLPTPAGLVLPSGFPKVTGEVRLTDLLLFSHLTGQTVTLKHAMQNIYGLELESTIKNFGVRGDIAYFDQSSFFTQELTRKRRPAGQAMVGVDYNSATAWYSNIQFFQGYVFNYDPNIIWADKRISAINGTVSKELLNGNLKPECRFYYDFSGNAALLNPKIMLKFWEPLIVEFGAELFDGSEETPLGIFGENDLLYVQFEASF